MVLTVQDIVILGSLVALGWLLGFLSRSSGRHWRREAARERKRAEIAEAHANAANARIAELERQPASMVTPGTATAVAAAASGNRDDLSLIRGIGTAGEMLLNEAGYHRYAQIAALSDVEAATLEGRLGLPPGTIAHEDWRGQAATLERNPGAHAAHEDTPLQLEGRPLRLRRP